MSPAPRVPLHTLRVGQAFHQTATGLSGRLVAVNPGSATVRFDNDTRNVEISREALVELGPFPTQPAKD